MLNKEITDNKCLWKKSLEDKTSTSFSNPDPSLKCLSCNGFDCLYEPSRYVKNKLNTSFVDKRYAKEHDVE